MGDPIDAGTSHSPDRRILRQFRLASHQNTQLSAQVRAMEVERAGLAARLAEANLALADARRSAEFAEQLAGELRAERDALAARVAELEGRPAGHRSQKVK